MFYTSYNCNVCWYKAAISERSESKYFALIAVQQVCFDIYLAKYFRYLACFPVAIAVVVIAKKALSKQLARRAAIRHPTNRIVAETMVQRANLITAASSQWLHWRCRQEWKAGAFHSVSVCTKCTKNRQRFSGSPSHLRQKATFLPFSPNLNFAPRRKKKIFAKQY